MNSLSMKLVVAFLLIGAASVNLMSIKIIQLIGNIRVLNNLVMSITCSFELLLQCLVRIEFDRYYQLRVRLLITISIRLMVY